MPNLSGLFDCFDNLDQIDINLVASWLKSPPSTIQLENYLANRILYPQSVPLTDSDMKIDLAFLREALRINGPKTNVKADSLLGDNPFLNVTLRKVIIPEVFLTFVPNLVQLSWAFIDGLLLDRKKDDWFGDLWTVVISDNVDQVIGTVLLPQFKDLSDFMDFSLLGKTYKIRAGSLSVIPCLRQRCEIVYKFNAGKFLGKKESALEVYGGKLGLMIDGRTK